MTGINQDSITVSKKKHCQYRAESGHLYHLLFDLLGEEIKEEQLGEALLKVRDIFSGKKLCDICSYKRFAANWKNGEAHDKRMRDDLLNGLRAFYQSHPNLDEGCSEMNEPACQAMEGNCPRCILEKAIRSLGDMKTKPPGEEE